MKKDKKTEEPEKSLIIDATHLIAGRLASYAAKKALLGYRIIIINSENAVITGDRKNIVEKYAHLMRETGRPFKGPFLSRLPDRFLRRIIKKMLPFKKYRGAIAYKKIMCHLGIPENLKGKAQTLKEADITTRKVVKFSTLHDICKELGWKK